MFAEWLVAAYVLESGAPYSFVGHEPLMAIAQDKHPFQVWIKSAQVGATALAIGLALWYAGEHGRRVIYYVPDDTLLPDHTNVRVRPAIEGMPYLINKVANRNAIGTISFSPGALHNLGLRSKMAKHSRPADVLLFDEVDKSDQTDVFTALSRLEHATDPVTIYFSTPTIPGFGISKLYNERSDQRSLMTKCGACGKWTAREWLNGVVKREGDYDYQLRDAEWTEGAGRDVYVYCLNCGKPLDLAVNAEWVAAYLEREYHGYKMGPLDFRRHAVAKYWREMQGIIGDEALMSIFFNERIGVPYASKGSQLDAAALDAIKGDYLPENKSAFPCILGADIGQASGHRYVVKQLNPPRVLAVGKASWDDLDELYTRYDNIVAAVIDGEPDTTRAIEFQRSHRNVYLADYPAAGNHGIYIDIKERNDDAGKPVVWVNLDRTVACDLMVGAVRKGEFALPKNAEALGHRVPGEHYCSFYGELIAPARVYESTKKGPRAVWRESGADHYFHAMVYAGAATELATRGGPPVYTPAIRDEGYL